MVAGDRVWCSQHLQPYWLGTCKSRRIHRAAIANVVRYVSQPALLIDCAFNLQGVMLDMMGALALPLTMPCWQLCAVADQACRSHCQLPAQHRVPVQVTSSQVCGVHTIPLINDQPCYISMS